MYSTSRLTSLNMSPLHSGYTPIKCFDVLVHEMIDSVALTSLDFQIIVPIVRHSLQECFFTWTFEGIWQDRKCVVNCNIPVHPCFYVVKKFHPQQGVGIGVSQLGRLCSLRFDRLLSLSTLGLILYWFISNSIHLDIRRVSGSLVRRSFEGSLV